jgi:hypothetical protein
MHAGAADDEAMRRDLDPPSFSRSPSGEVRVEFAGNTAMHAVFSALLSATRAALTSVTIIGAHGAGVAASLVSALHGAPRIERLVCESCSQLGPEGAAALAAVLPSLPITSLVVRGPFELDGLVFARAVARHAPASLAELEFIGLEMADGSPLLEAALACSTRLRVLRLQRCSVDVTGENFARGLAGAALLEVLEVSGAPVPPGASDFRRIAGLVAALAGAQAGAPPRFRTLSLPGVGMGDSFVGLLLESLPQLPALEELCLVEAALSDSGAAKLAKMVRERSLPRAA